MKKHLIAAAVAGALAVPAMAQVSVSGYLEAGYVSRDTLGTGAVANQKVKQTTFGGDPFGTNNLTFKGTEDLGGGLKAQFQLTQEFGSNVTHVTADEGTDTDWEQAWVQLSGGFGAVRIGTLSDPAQEAGARYRFFGDVGRISSRDGSNEKNALLYTSPKVGGVSASIFSLAQGKSSADVEQDKRTSVLIRGDFGGLSVGLSHQKYNTDNAGDDVIQGISAQYNFGMAKVGALYQTWEDDSSATDEKTKVTALQAMVPMGKFAFGVGRNEYKDDDSKLETTHLMANYALSKRTSVNFAYETAKTGATVPNKAQSSSTPGTNGLATGYVPNETTKGMALSISHKF